jgi:hypothetical protein
MSAPSLNSVGNIIVKKSPPGSKRLYYFAKRSSPLGVTPTQLRGNAEKMKSLAPQCAQQVRGMPPGMEKVQAFRGCIAEKM